MTTPAKPTLLLILDGWGHRDDASFNAIKMADTPVWDELLETRPNTLIHTSGLKVGLPEGQMGNSEVGHMNLGAGRVVYQSLTRINKSISDGDFFENPTLCETVDDVTSSGAALHIMGLLSPGGIHSHEDQIEAMIDLALERGCKNIYLHAFLDGRDTPPRSAAASLKKFEAKLQSEHCGHIATIAGRFYAMDRDNRWDRVEKAYQAIQGNASHHYTDPIAALDAAYARDENDEFVTPSCLHLDNESAVKLEDGDALIFMNFRADRAREMARVFVDADFDGFEKGPCADLSHFVSLTQYAENIASECAYLPLALNNVLGEHLANHNKTQLRIAETEKYAHVTFFFSGGRENEFNGETRTLIPSPDVITYDLKPEMSAYEVCEKLVTSIKNKEFDAIICNFANGDMVGHTGVVAAAIKAVEVLDECLGKITQAILEAGGDCLITADHGNVEKMRDADGQTLTSHTNGPVPLVYVGNKSLQLKKDGALSDIAPSLLALMQMEQPVEMTGQSLVQIE